MHPRYRRRALVVILAALAASCNNGNSRTITPIPMTPTTPTTPTPAPQPDVIEYRVTGNVTSVAVKTDDPINGASIVVTGLPYSATVTSTRVTLFVSLDAATLSALNGSGTYYGNFVLAQVFVNGTLFLQASDQSALPHATVSGTWRR